MAEQNGTNTGKCAEEYVVKRGDSFYLIAHKLGVPLRDLLAANRDIHPARLMVGDVLCVPREEDDSPQAGGLGGSTNGGVSSTTQSGGTTQTTQATGTTQSGTTTQSGGMTTQATGTTQSGTTQTTQATGTTQSGATTQSGGMTTQATGTAQGSGTTSGTQTTQATGMAGTTQTTQATGMAQGTGTTSGAQTTQATGTTSGAQTAQATGMTSAAQPTCMTGSTGQTAPDTTLYCTEDEQWIVQKGQTVSDLQLRGLVSRHTLETANPGVDLENLSVGQTVCIPKDNVPCALPETYTLAATETLEAVAMRFNLPVASLLRANPCLAPQDFEGGVTVILPK